MNDTHLEQPDLDPDVTAAMAEVTKAMDERRPEQELRQTALMLAVRVFLRPTKHEYDDVVKTAEAFYTFLTVSSAL